MFQYCHLHPSILIVDDVSFNVMALKMLLMKKSFTSDECYNGVDAVQQVKSRFNSECKEPMCRYYRFILMDIEMPLMDGLEATE